LLKRKPVEIGCSSGAVPKNGMENKEIIGVSTTVYDDPEGLLAHI
jgi:hypothetical protein